ncbi:nonstructural protein [Capybara microvirus Cap3_SP_481]|nr:nonstructural protein [Capybara microvirus Cap3_SP_481]
MIKELYAISDIVEGEMKAPFIQPNLETAKRTFREACRNIEGIKEHSEDMQLFSIGTFNTETGDIIPKVEFIERGKKNE